MEFGIYPCFCLNLIYICVTERELNVESAFQLAETGIIGHLSRIIPSKTTRYLHIPFELQINTSPYVYITYEYGFRIVLMDIIDMVMSRTLCRS